jgi:hypothetical protein
MMTLPTRRNVPLLVLLLAARGLAGQSPSTTSRYLVTTTSLSLFDSGPKLCIGIDPTDPTGVWWWQEGQSGCSTRSTGPDVFPAQYGTVTTGSDQMSINVHFRLAMHVGDPLEVRLTIRGGRMFVSGADVPDTGQDVGGVAVERRDGLVPPFVALTHSGSAQAAINARQAWGPVVNGLRMAVALTEPGAAPSRGTLFDVMFQNVGDKEVVLELGVRSNTERFLFPVRLLLDDPDGHSMELRLDDRAQITSGRLDDLTVPLPAGATHVVRVHLEQYVARTALSPLYVPLGALGEGHYRIASQFEGVGLQFPASGHLANTPPPVLPFWIGTLRSNVLDFDVSP